MSRGWSFFIVGLAVGVLLSTIGFSILSRGGPTGDGPGQIVLRMAHGLDEAHPVHLAMVHMKRSLAEKSGGTVQIQIFAGGQLGGETECIEQLQRGVLALTKVSTAPLESFVPEMAVFGVPYAFTDSDHYWRVLESDLGRELLSKPISRGLRGLCYYDAGSRSFYTRDRAIHSPADLTGLNIRVQESRTAMDMIQALGASPVTVPWGELYTALQQGMVDGAENNPPSVLTSGHYEVSRYFSLNEHTMVPDIVLISESIWQGLPRHVRQWLQEAAEESSIEQRRIWREMTEDALAGIEARGVSIIRPDKEPLIERVRPMHRRYVGTPVGSLLDQIREMAP